jgi:hypothetical protein
MFDDRNLSDSVQIAFLYDSDFSFCRHIVPGIVIAIVKSQ